MAEGKVFTPDSVWLNNIKSLSGISSVSFVLEDNALLKSGNKQFIATIKGVDDNNKKVSGVSQNIIAGRYAFIDTLSGTPKAVLGAGIMDALALNPDDPYAIVSIYAPDRLQKTLANPLDAFRNEQVLPGGAFAIQQDFDDQYVLVSLPLARELFNYSHEVSAIEISATKGANIDLLENQLKAISGNQFVVKNRFEQNAFLYRVMQIEKWVVFSLLSLILLIASFNMVGSLSMVALDKNKDVAILKTLGATPNLIRQIFFMVGIIMTGIGAIAGIMVAVLVLLAQEHFHFLKLTGTSFVIDAYPVEMRWQDFVWVLLVVLLTGLITAWLPAMRAGSQQYNLRSN